MRTSIALLALAASTLSLPAAAQSAPVLRTVSPSIQAAAPASGSGSYSAATSYIHDDGEADFLVGSPIDADFCLIHQYRAFGTTDVIRSIQVSYTGNLGFNQGWVCVWDDPNEDGVPLDATLLVAQPVTLQNNSLNQFSSYPIPPVVVHEQFFVGIVATLPSFTFNLYMDSDSGHAGNAWYCWSSQQGNFNFQDLTANAQPPLENFQAGNPGVWMLRAEGGITQPTTYCMGKLNSVGCVPAMSAVGVSSSSASSGFSVEAQLVRNRKNGLLTYSVDGRDATPFQGGTLCVASPVRRTPPVASGGNPAPAQDCSGVYAIDMNAFAAGGLGGSPPAALSVPGTTVDCQWWGRDPGESSGFGSSLSDALEYVVGF